MILYQSQTTFRQIFMDGRPLPKDAEPSWYGYSIGRWDGNALVVESAGFNDKTWLDGFGHPHSEEMRLTERFTRRNVGLMDVEVSIDDPKAYKETVKYVQSHRLLPERTCSNTSVTRTPSPSARHNSSAAPLLHVPDPSPMLSATPAHIASDGGGNAEFKIRHRKRGCSIDRLRL